MSTVFRERNQEKIESSLGDGFGARPVCQGGRYVMLPTSRGKGLKEEWKDTCDKPKKTACNREGQISERVAEEGDEKVKKLVQDRRQSTQAAVRYRYGENLGLFWKVWREGNVGTRREERVGQKS